MSRRIVYIPTNNPAAVALSYGCHLGNLPGWLRIIDHPHEFDAIPMGALVGAAVWIGGRDEIAAWESVWTPRKLKAGFDWVSPEQEAAMRAWFAEHRAEPECLRGRKAETAEAAGGPAERRDDERAAPRQAEPEFSVEIRQSRWV